jgi:hypothetical protein
VDGFLFAEIEPLQGVQTYSMCVSQPSPQEFHQILNQHLVPSQQRRQVLLRTVDHFQDIRPYPQLLLQGPSSTGLAEQQVAYPL